MENLVKKFESKEKGFTLMEVLIGIAIIGFLASMVLVNVNTAREKARIAVAKAESREIYNAFILLESDTFQWPGHKTPYEVEEGSDNEICPDGCTYSLSDPQAGLTATDGNYGGGWDGPYLDEIPTDPWGTEYFFDTDYDIDPGEGQDWAAVIGSYGPNGVGNNQYDDDDIYYIIK